MWGALITSVLMTVAGRIIAAFGLSFISYVGLNELQDYFIGSVSQQIGGIPDDVLQVAYIAGFGVILNWVFGTVAFITSIKSLSKLSAVMSRK